MKIPKLSIYFYLFNARIREFDLEGTIENFCQFADEVVCATIPSEDDTLERLKAQETARGSDRFKVVETSITLKSNRFDGELKTAAYQACTKHTDQNPRVYIIADADERFPVSQKDKWLHHATILLNLKIDGWLIPVVDLYKDENHIRNDKEIGFKFRMHRNTVASRGVLPAAEVGNGKFDTNRSDSTEPLDGLGELSNFIPIISNSMFLDPSMTAYLKSYPYVLHYGWLDIERRAKLNKEFWKPHWENRSNHAENVPTSVEELKDFPLTKHSLPLI